MNRSNSSWSTEPYSSAVIMASFWNDEEKQRYYLMGHDVQKTNKIGKNDWSAFGGYKKNEEMSPIDTAIREAVEETIDILIPLDRNQIEKRAVTFEIKQLDSEYRKNYIFVIDLFSSIEEECMFTQNQIYEFHSEFKRLRQGNKLVEDQKEKHAIGWLKAGDVTKQSLLPSACFTIYTQPSVTSIKITEIAEIRFSQKEFFKIVLNEKNGLENIINGWSGFEGQTITIKGKKIISQTKNQSNLISGTKIVNTNSNLQSQNNSSVQIEDNFPAEDSQGWKTQNDGKKKFQSINNSNASKNIYRRENGDFIPKSAEIKLIKKPSDNFLAEDSQGWKTQNNAKKKSQNINNSNNFKEVSQTEKDSLTASSTKVKSAKKPWDGPI